MCRRQLTCVPDYYKVCRVYINACDSQKQVKSSMQKQLGCTKGCVYESKSNWQQKELISGAAKNYKKSFNVIP